uniref:PAZ domain-containing protein n=1 Tax=Timema tahoe TaxID=61484 RepID=A0A7R9IRA3_9NEOP|nr:unnamed protein product [Timema tahoe]
MRDLRVGAGDNGNGNGAAGQGRGTMRGRRTIQFDNIRTRPEHVNSKLGTSGQSVKLSANYFEVLHHTDWCLYQYRVDFAPEEDRTGLRKAMLRDHKKVIGGYIFDGTMMFTSHRLNPDPMELFSTRQSDEAQIRITIKLVGDLSQGDSHYLQFFNIIMRKCLGHLKLQLVGRNFFDARAKVDIREFKLELWPGYITSIRQHEMKIMMCAEITHKVMRQDNVLDLLSECHRQSSNDPRNTFVKAIVGSVVLTDYNNRTYRIDDVDWDVTPASTFPLKEGATISYKDYYSQKYQINITQPKQPMLVSRSKPRELRAGMSELIYLVPELCRMTGLTDEMRANFHLMRALAEHTRVGPDIRIQKLNNFCNRLLGEQAVRQDLDEWNLQLSNRLVEFNGRILPQEKILQAQDIKYDAGADTDWTRNLRSNPLLIIPQLQFWVVIVPNRASRDAGGFIQTLIKAAGGMRFIMPKPQVSLLGLESALASLKAGWVFMVLFGNSLSSCSCS